nr:hypothetical protein Iba_chr04dCG0500 [Ipomoea batatas]
MSCSLALKTLSAALVLLLTSFSVTFAFSNSNGTFAFSSSSFLRRSIYSALRSTADSCPFSFRTSSLGLASPNGFEAFGFNGVPLSFCCPSPMGIVLGFKFSLGLPLLSSLFLPQASGSETLFIDSRLPLFSLKLSNAPNFRVSSSFLFVQLSESAPPPFDSNPPLLSTLRPSDGTKDLFAAQLSDPSAREFESEKNPTLSPLSLLSKPFPGVNFLDAPQSSVSSAREGVNSRLSSLPNPPRRRDSSEEPRPGLSYEEPYDLNPPPSLERSSSSAVRSRGPVGREIISSAGIHSPQNPRPKLPAFPKRSQLPPCCVISIRIFA